MNTLNTLPAYADAALANLDTDELIELLARDEDRVPRNVIDECARRSDTIVHHLNLVLEHYRWDAETPHGEWWRLLHAVMILGLVPTEAAGLLLVQYMRRMSEEDDDNLQDWLASHWPAIFSNKPASLMSALRALSEDRDCDHYIRTCATDVVVAMAQRTDSATLDDALENLAAAARDETEDWDYRLLTANTLLDFPRPQYRELLEGLAKRQKKFSAVFLENDIEKSYVEAKDKPDWQQRRRDPWAFYEPQAISTRQERWAREDQEEREREDLWQKEGASFEDVIDPYVRPEAKIGRNDPCPCGSGKKYKKCCLNDNAAG